MKKLTKILMILAAILVGCVVNYIGDALLGVRIELFWGGLGGKWWAYFPPLIVRLAAYFETEYFIGVPDGAHLMPMGWWAFFVILAIECSAIGGVFGEIMVKRIYGWTDAGRRGPTTDATSEPENSTIKSSVDSSASSPAKEKESD
jgi:hypothetical protein